MVFSGLTIYHYKMTKALVLLAYTSLKLIEAIERFVATKTVHPFFTGSLVTDEVCKY